MRLSPSVASTIACGVLILALGHGSPGAAADAPNAPIKPLGLDGKPINLDFETGTLKDWVATGDAFTSQPIHGDTVAKRRGDMRSGHQGEYWIGGFEVMGDDATGTLTSAPFVASHRWASFLVSAGWSM